METLDEKDKKILHLLDLNARLPATAIGKKLRLSPDSVLYRISQMEKKGIIRGYYSLLNVFMFGYGLYKIFISLKNPSGTKNKEFVESLKKHPSVGLVSLVGGDYDLSVGIIAKSNFEFEQIINKILLDYTDHIKSKDISVITSLHQYNKKFLNGSEPQEWVFKPIKKPIAEDAIDRKIISAITNNGRMQTTEIAQKTGIDRKTVSNRLKKYASERMILGYRVTLNRDYIKRTFYRLLIKLQTADEKSLNSMDYYLRCHDSTVFSLNSLGAWDMELEITTETIKECYDFISELKEKFEFVKEVRMLPAFNDVKYSFNLS